MKTRTAQHISVVMIFIIFLTTLTGCTSLEIESDTKNPSQDSGAKSENRCGDGVCDGPETIQNCSSDCESSQSAPVDSVGNGERTPKTESANDVEYAQVYFDVTVQRKDGEGTCGTFPYGVDNIFGGDNSCQGAKYWYTYVFRITALQNLDIIEQTDGTWLLKSDKLGGGTYQLAEASDDGQRLCHPVQVNTDPFDFDFVAEVQQGTINFTIYTLPLEITDWKCDSGTNYQRETTLVLIHWANAISGDYQDLSGSLSAANQLSPGGYHREYSGSFNSSPENRDSVRVVMDLTCQSGSGGAYEQIACPWE
jgi:hypothetical protein